jgi:hypothetical protein
MHTEERGKSRTPEANFPKALPGQETGAKLATRAGSAENSPALTSTGERLILGPATRAGREF